MRRVRRGTTGLVWKNDVNRHGCGITRDGLLSGKHKCHQCERELEATDTVIYAFIGRGTMSAVSAYYCDECFKAITATSSTPRGSAGYCRICQKGKCEVRIPVRYNRNIWIHKACVPEISTAEVAPKEEVLKAAEKRSEERLKRARVRYCMRVKIPYDGHSLLLEKGSYLREEKGSIVCRVKVRPFDGKLVSVDTDQYPYVTLFRGYWCKKGRIFLEIEDYEKDVANPKVHHAKPLPDGFYESMLELQKELQRHYNVRGYPINERLDADFELRFLLKNGNTIEGMLDDLEEAK